MKLRIFDSSHPLYPHVECLWFADETGKDGGMEKLMPMATVEIVMDLSNDLISVYEEGSLKKLTFDDAVVCGVHTVPFLIDANDGSPILGVHFNPGGFFAFHNQKMSTLHNTHKALGEFWGDEAAALRKDILDASDLEERFDIWEKFLVEKLKEARSGRPEVSRLISQGQKTEGNLNLSEFAEREGLSSQRLIELFKREVGVSPKAFLNVTRFQTILVQLQGKVDIDWTELSLDKEYFDQAHFNKCFKKHSSMTPKGYHAKDKRHPSHVSL